MLDLLNKYYEYFLKLEKKEKGSSTDDTEFDDFYSIIINEYDLESDEQLSRNLNAFFNFFDHVSPIGERMKGRFNSSTEREEQIKKLSFKRYNCSFAFFKASKYMLKTRDRNFLYTINSTNKDIFCKVYLSIRPDKYIEVMLKIQAFIEQLYMNHPDEEIGQCKFRKNPANDAIVMRFACEQHYNEFLQYLSQNPDITSSFDTPNPFMPRESNGLSIIPDNHGSYNYFVAKIIWEYMKMCREKNKDVSLEEMVEFVNSYDYSKDERLYSNGEIFINYYKIILTGKLLSKADNEIIQAVFNNKKEENNKRI